MHMMVANPRFVNLFVVANTCMCMFHPLNREEEDRTNTSSKTERERLQTCSSLVIPHSGRPHI